MKESVEVADIFRAFGPSYRQRYEAPLPLRHHRAMRAIETCRTAVLGGHVEECDVCGAVRISYNSCRNRHCPKCQCLATERWIEDRKQDLLPVSYFHVVLMLPEELRPLALRNQKVVYSLLFKAPSETLLALASDPKHLGAQIGFTAILHTDSADGDRTKRMPLSAFEFIRRFLLHILPEGFVKIRHYGILSNRNRKTKLWQARQILCTWYEQVQDEEPTWQELLYRLTGIDPGICPACGKGQMMTKEVLFPKTNRSPPHPKRVFA